MAKANLTKWNERAGAAGNARSTLPKVVAAYFARVREFLRGDPSPAELHAVRLETKRLRYTLELFRPVYGPGLETRLAALRRLQQTLGEVNDYAATRRLLEKSMVDSPQRARVIQFLEGRAAATARAFRKDWAEQFDAPGQEQLWTMYLARNARQPHSIQPPPRTKGPS